MGETGTPIRSAFYQSALDRGADFVDFDGWCWVNGYGDAIAEHHSVRNRVGVWDVSPLRKWEFTGRDALRAADWILANDVAGMRAGQVRYGPFCDENGKMIGDGTVFKFSDTRCWVVTAADSDRDHFDRALAELGEIDLEIRGRTLELPQLQVQGPGSRDLLGRLAPAVADLGYFSFLTEPVELEGVSCTVSRTGYSGELGYEIFCEPEAAPRLWEVLFASSDGLVPYGLLAVETLRIESGLIFVGYDYFPGETDPFEMSLDKLIRLDKPGFFGKDALAQIAEAPPRRFVTVVVDGDQIPDYGARVSSGDREVGQVRSPCLSPTLERVIGLTAIETELAERGTRVEVALGDATASATVDSLPLYDPEKRRPRS